MSTIYRYSLEKGSKKHLCPNCGKKSLKRYIDNNTGEYLPEQFGRCDHENSCAPHYHLSPKAMQEHEKVSRSELPNYWKPQPIAKDFSPITTRAEQVFFDFDTFKKTLEPERLEKNTFIQNLLTNVAFPFEPAEVIKVIELYRLGTIASGYRAGAVTFPFIDEIGNVRAIQVKQFDEQNHTTGTDFLHSIIEKHLSRNNKPLPEWLKEYIKQDKRISCLFAEHLLRKYPKARIYLFEAPKTAIYGTLYFGHPEKSNIICLAVYNKSSLSFDKIKVLQGRIVFVFPDLSKDGNTFREWEIKAKEFEKHLQGTRFIFSDLLEQLAPQEDKSEGKDIADYLILQDWKEYRKSAPQLAPKKIPAEAAPSIEPLQKIEQPKRECWEQEINELENYFASIEIPTHPVKLYSYGTITDCSKFIEAHFIDLKVYSGNKRFTPYLSRMQELKQILSK